MCAITETLIKDMKPGDTMETKSPFMGLTKEKMVWTLEKTPQEDNPGYMFKTSYYGVFTGFIQIDFDEAGKASVRRL